MISKWRVKSIVVAGVTFYEVYRRTERSGAMQRVQRYGGYWTTEKEAQDLADRLNEREGNVWN